MQNVIFLNSDLKRVGIIEQTKFISASVINTLNEARTIDLELITELETKTVIDDTKFMVVFDGVANRFFRKDNLSFGNTISIHGTEVGFDDFTAKTVTDVSNRDTVYNVLDYTKPNDYVLNVEDGIDITSTNEAFTYNLIGTALENLLYVVNNLKVDFDFSIIYDIETNTITKYLNLYKHLGSENAIHRYVYGSNANEVLMEENSSDTYTAAVGLGYNTLEDITEQSAEELNSEKPLKFNDVAWTLANGKPVNKPFEQDYVEIAELTEKVALLNGNPRTKVFKYPEIKDASVLLERTYLDLVEIARPKVQFRMNSDIFFDSEIKKGVSNLVTIGDNVAILRYDLNMRYKTRIFKLTRNLITNLIVDLEFGDMLFTSRAKQIKTTNKKIDANKAKTDKNIAKIKSLEQTIMDLNQRLNDLEEFAGMPQNDEEEVIEHSPSSYFTYEDYEGGYSISGMSELGTDAINAKLITHITTPETYNDLPITAVMLRGGYTTDRVEIYMPDYVFRVTKNIKVFTTHPVRLTAKHLRIDEGVESLFSNGVNSGNLNITSRSLRIPDSILSIGSFYQSGLNRLSVPYFYQDVAGNNTFNIDFTKYRDPFEKTKGDFTYLEVSVDNTTVAKITGLSEGAISKDLITIPEKIGSYFTDLVTSCFRGYGAVKEVKVESDVYTLPSESFYRCTLLNNIDFKSVEILGSSSFMYCLNLKTLNFGSTVILNSIGSYAFSESGLEEFIMPDSIQKVETRAFNKTYSLKKVVLSNQLTEISGNCFDVSALEGVLTIPNSVTSISEYAFSVNKLTGLSVSSSSKLLTINKGAFVENQINAVKLPSITYLSRTPFDSGVVVTRY